MTILTVAAIAPVGLALALTFQVAFNEMGLDPIGWLSAPVTRRVMAQVYRNRPAARSSASIDTELSAVTLQARAGNPLSPKASPDLGVVVATAPAHAPQTRPSLLSTALQTEVDALRLVLAEERQGREAAERLATEERQLREAAEAAANLQYITTAEAAELGAEEQREMELGRRVQALFAGDEGTLPETRGPCQSTSSRSPQRTMLPRTPLLLQAAHPAHLPQSSAPGRIEEQGTSPGSSLALELAPDAAVTDRPTQVQCLQA